jgi:hypothetical protein
MLIANQITYIFNLSFSQGLFPQLLKSAIVTPIHKSGSKLDPGNYRPISILTLFSKLLEKLFYNRLISFVNNHNILHPLQFGFRADYSTSTAIAHVLSSLITKINNKKHTVLALFDLKKAFDLVNHKLLLTKLMHYGIRGIPQQWLTSYLFGRFQKTKVGNISSNSKPISAGVPQGSILGPLLFLLFVNDVFQLATFNVEIYLYADDTAFIFHADSNSQLQCIINKFLNLYNNWCSDNYIVINPMKSCYLTFNNANVVLTINDQLLANPTSVKYLGILIDNKLNWSQHVNHVYKLCCQRIGIFKRVLSYLPSSVVPMYYNAFIRSCFAYCITYWFNNDRSGKYKLINKIDNLILFLSKKLNLTVPDFCLQTGICNVNVVHELQCLSLMYDIVNNGLKLPFFHVYTNAMVHTHNTRTVNNLHINCITALDRRNFIYQSTLFWNKHLCNNRMLHKRAFLLSCKSLLI